MGYTGESLKENYGLDNLLRWLMRDEGKAGEEPEKLLKKKKNIAHDHHQDGMAIRENGIHSRRYLMEKKK